jgi:hypothetical protein
MNHKNQPITVASAADLQALIASNRPRLFPTETAITVAVPGFTTDQTQTWQRKLTALANPCGCGVGMVFLMTAVIGYIAYAILAAQSAQSSTSTLTAWFFVKHILAGLLVSFVAAGVGKAVGLILAQYQFKRVCAQLLIQIKQIEREK